MGSSSRGGVLFVSHEASRTGSPIALLNFLRWFKENSDRPFSVLLARGGELTPQFEEVAETWSMERAKWRVESLRGRLLFFAAGAKSARLAESREVRRFAARDRTSLVYVNSIPAARAAAALSPMCPILTHVHELEYSFRIGASPELSDLISKSRRFIACSRAVGDYLERGQRVATDRVEIVHETIPVQRVSPGRSRKVVCGELGVPEDAHLIVGGGSHSWRKGADLFVQLARAVCGRRSDAYFVWVGGACSDIAEIDIDSRLVGLSGRVRLTGPVANAADYIAAGDLFALTSREDPYPLICLEAAALGKPIVCFAGAGGMPEFVEDDCGFVVPYLDVAAMAARAVALLDHDECRRKMGEAAQLKVRKRHDIGVTGPRILEIIERTIGGG